MKTLIYIFSLMLMQSCIFQTNNKEDRELIVKMSEVIERQVYLNDSLQAELDNCRMNYEALEETFN